MPISPDGGSAVTKALREESKECGQLTDNETSQEVTSPLQSVSGEKEKKEKKRDSLICVIYSCCWEMCAGQAVPHSSHSFHPVVGLNERKKRFQR
jgi:hypothetical protein